TSAPRGCHAWPAPARGIHSRGPARRGQASRSSPGGRLAGLVGALGVRDRNPVDQGAVVLSWRGQLLRRGGLALLALSGLGLAALGLLAVAESLRLRLEDTHRTAERAGAVRQFLGPEEHQHHC